MADSLSVFNSEYSDSLNVFVFFQTLFLFKTPIRPCGVWIDSQHSVILKMKQLDGCSKSVDCGIKQPKCKDYR